MRRFLKRQFSGKKNFKLMILNSPFWLVIGFIIFIFAFSAFLKITWQKIEIQGQIDKLKKEAEMLETDNKYLIDSLDFFASESFKEREMRLKLNLQKPDERVIIISRDENRSKEEIPASADDKSQMLANIKKWREYFFRK
ncbi:hypothetical protein KKB43_02070 [Patescibacteria group bacterium]|nr:hypothetical protein [Patescibacteria group bacterium]MBU4579780.1 hypothetical protein [Patescibacteria group bacterium]